AETEALARLGIDVSEIVARGEDAHGVGAMSGDRRGRGRRCGHRPFAPDAQEALTGPLRAATAPRDRALGHEPPRLALTARPGAPAEVLADHGVTYASLTRVLYGGGEAKEG